MRWPRLLGTVSALIVVTSTAACASSESSGPPEPAEQSESELARSSVPDVPAPDFVLDVRDAVAAVEAELGGPQEYFEVTSNEQFTNVFVAVDDATAAVAYAFVDGELQAPAPKQEGAEGNTFVAADIDFADDRILSRVAVDLPASEIDAVSVYGDGVGATYVLAATSSAGGFLDIVVGPDGSIFSVDPV